MSQNIAATPLNHYLTELPDAHARYLHRKAFAFSALEKISWVALVAIATFVIVSTLGAPAVTGAVSVAMVVLSFSVLFFAWGAMVCRSRSQEALRQAGIEEQVAKELEQIKGWSSDQVKQHLQGKTKEVDGFLQNKNRHLPLTQIDKEPLCALKPLIARINYLEKRSKEIQAAAFQVLKKTKTEGETRTETKRKIEHLSRELAARDLENRAYPMLFEAATLWTAIAYPAKEHFIEDKGRFILKSHGERLSDQIYSEDDQYFVFHDKSKEAIAFSGLEHLSSHELADRLEHS